ncbi:MAG: hypothetical protein EF813_07645 [Methanosarcinales archaeon]|nr:MAG: hypothetical protein EF813_07645 [Methanosarcinales archaeon]
MKQLLIVILLIALVTAPVASADCLQVTKTTMQFNGTDTVFTIDYELDFLVRLYVLAFGSANIAPEIEARFVSFDNVSVRKIGCEQAIVDVKNVSHQNNEYYFHNSHDFGMTIEKLVVKLPDGYSRTYRHTNTTPDLYYESNSS